jgi:hypothetical protein
MRRNGGCIILSLILLSSVPAAVVVAFAPNAQNHAGGGGVMSRLAASTMEEKSVPPPAQPIKKEAPLAGWEPDWEDRPSGLTQDQFLQSDVTLPDLAGMWECPLTRWDSDGYVLLLFCRRRLFD